MTTYTLWKVGDIINICATIDEFCTTTPFIYTNDINVTKQPNPCTVNFGSERGCGLHLNNVKLTFRLVNSSGSSNDSNCTPQQIYKTLGSARTGSNGAAGISYTVTEQDRLDSINAAGTYKVMACITNSDGQTTASSISDATEAITIEQATHLECVNGICTRVNGVGSDTCTPEGSTAQCTHLECINEICTRVTGAGINMCETEGSTTECAGAPTSTHYLDLIVTPWSWYDPNGVAPAIIEKLADIDGAITNFFNTYGIIDYQYLGTVIVTVNNKVIIRVKLRNTSLQSMAVPFLVKVAVVVVVVGIIITLIGWIAAFIFRTIGNPFNQAPDLTNNDLTSAGVEFMTNLMNDCELVTCSDISLTQDQKALCIKNCIDSSLTNWNDYQDRIYPDVNHAPLIDAKTVIQQCYDTYNLSGKTPTDYQTFLNCAKITREQAVTTDKDTTLDTYKPDASAGEKESRNALQDLLLYGGLVLIGSIIISNRSKK